MRERHIRSLDWPAALSCHFDVNIAEPRHNEAGHAGLVSELNQIVSYIFERHDGVPDGEPRIRAC